MKESVVIQSPAGVDKQPGTEDWDNLDFLTFTGLDYRTDFASIWRIGERYPRVEFAVLLGSQTGDPAARRYPDLKEVKWWRGLARKSDRPIAIHLCGRFARAGLGDGNRDEILELCRGFGRVQINASDYNQAQVEAFAEAVDCPRVILQKRQPFEADWVLPDPKVEYLFDRSGGQGLESLTNWPPPDARERRSGYAGGLNQSNIIPALEFVASLPDHRLWLDIESGVRTSNDWLQIGQVEAICAIAFPSH